MFSIRTYLPLLITIVCQLGFNQLSFAQIVNIPDENFKEALINQGYDLNGDGEIQNSEAEVITSLTLNNKSIASLEGIKSFTNLKSLEAEINELVELDLSGLNLITIRLTRNELTSISIGDCIDLEELDVGANDIHGLDISNSKKIKILIAVSNQNLGELDNSSLDNVEELKIGMTGQSSMDFSRMTNLKEVDISFNAFTSVDFTGLENLELINVGVNPLDQLIIPSSEKLKSLTLQFSGFTDINFSDFPNLESLNTSGVPFGNIDLSQNSKIDFLFITSNELSELDLTTLSNLRNLYCGSNPIQDLDFSNNQSLEHLDIAGCDEIKLLDFTNNQELEKISISGSGVREIVGTDFINLKKFNGNGSKITELDLSMSSKLEEVKISGDIEILQLKNGSDEELLINQSGASSLQYICADEDEVLSFESYIENNSNVTSSPLINSYCSFTPGGAIYSIYGSNILDYNLDGCDENDFYIPHLKYDISNTNGIQGAIVTDQTGFYNIDLQAGIHTIKPRFENPEYFTTPQSSIVVNFPFVDSPFNQDFCVSPNGVKNDLEVVIIALDEVVPGFNGRYKIIYKNKGNTVLSGQVDLNYLKNHMEILYLSENFDNEGVNSLSWKFEDLLPMEAREIDLEFEFNKPTDDIAINGDDLLVFRAFVTPIAGDEQETDNSFLIKQVAVNSFDPNDKRCLQGEILDLENVGDYLHYMIRFENTGTANATNVVIADTLDASKFDVGSLQIIDASHSVQTRIRNNIAEFHFENIQLPFDDENNDGYVVFKIKTLETLQLGDNISNSAAIYFDFNFPIITNTYSTTVEQIIDEDGDGFNLEEDCDDTNADINPLATEIPGNGIDEDCSAGDLSSIADLEKYNIEVFPNPNDGRFQIQSEIEMTVVISDLNGKSLLSKSILPNNNVINIDDAQPGLYFIKFFHDGHFIGSQKLVVH